MNTRKRLLALAITLIGSIIAPTASAQTYNETITNIYGNGGNPDVGWTMNSENGFEIYGRGKDRMSGDTTNTNGVYQMPTGYYGVRAKWNFDFGARNTQGNLGGVKMYVLIDNDPSVGINFTNVIDVSLILDNSFGKDLTLAAGGIEGPWDVLAPSYNIVQQSHNVTFAAYAPLGFDPNANGTYDFEVYITEKDAGPEGTKLASVNFTVKVGTGGKSVDDLLTELAANATSHGEYVSSVSALTRYLTDGGVIDKKKRQELLTTAAKSDIGK